MQVRHLCAIIGILAMLGATQVALGDTHYFIVHYGDWSVSTNWDPAQVPGQNDTAIIGQDPAIATCVVTDEQSVGTLVVTGCAL
jgi:hypothetical protein